MLFSAVTHGSAQNLAWSGALTLKKGSVHTVVSFAVAGPSAQEVGQMVKNHVSQVRLRTAEDCYQLVSDCIKGARHNRCELYLSALFSFKTFVCYSTYNGSVFLRRGESAQQLIETGRDVGFVRGDWKEGDVVVLSTLGGSEVVSAVKERLLQGYVVRSLPKAMQPGVDSLQESALVSLVYVADEAFEASDELSQSAAPVKESDTETATPTPIAQPSIATGQMPAHSQKSQPDYTPTKPVVETDVVSSTTDKPQSSGLDVFKQKITLAKTKALSAFNAARTFAVSQAQKIKKSSAARKQVQAPSQDQTQEEVVPQRKQQLRPQATLRESIVAARFGISQRLRGKRAPMPQSLRGLDRSRLRRPLVIAGIVVLCVLALFVFLRIRSSTAAAQSQKAQALAQTFIDNAQAAQSLGSAQQVGAALEVIEADIEAAKQEYPQEVFQQALDAAHSQITQSLPEGVEAVSSFPEVFNYDDLGEDVAVGLVHGSASQLVLTNQTGRVLYIVDTTTKQVRELAVANPVTALTVVEDVVYYVSAGIWQLDLAGESLDPVLVRNSGNSNRGATQIAFYEGSLYVFTPAAENIFRYVGQEEGEFGQPIAWLTQELVFEPAQITQMIVDGDIWLQDEAGQILRYRSGEQILFEPQDEESLSQVVLTQTQEGLGLLGVSRQNGAVLQISDSGQINVLLTDQELAAAKATWLVADASQMVIALADRVVQVSVSLETVAQQELEQE